MTASPTTSTDWQPRPCAAPDCGRVLQAEVAYCPHPAFPVGCFCRKPLPGMGIALIERHQLAREHLLMVGDMDSDRDFARSLGIRYTDAADFFAGT